MKLADAVPIANAYIVRTVCSQGNRGFKYYFQDEIFYLFGRCTQNNVTLRREQPFLKY